MKETGAANCLLALLIAWTETALSQIHCDKNVATIAVLVNLHDSVNIISPNYTSSAYPQKETCYWTVKIENHSHSPNNTLKVVFNYFELENSPHCSNESLNFYNTYSGRSHKQLLGTFCGTTHPEVLYVSNLDIIFKFKPGQRGNYRGFSLTITVVLKAEANNVCHYPRWSVSSDGDTGTIFSPNYPANTPIGITCRWNITVSEGRVRLIIKDLQLSSNNCSPFSYKPFVRVEDSKGLLLLASCTAKTPIVLESRYPRLWVTLHTTSGTPHRGFKAHYEAIPFGISNVECVPGNPKNHNLTLEGSSGTFHGPQYIPAPLSTSPTCIWIITVPDGKVVKLSFDLPYSSHTRDDYVEIRDGRYSTSNLKVERLYRSYYGPYLRSSGRYMRIEYTSSRRANVAKPTFNADFKAEDFLSSNVECVEGNPNNKNLTLEGLSGTFQGPRDIPASFANSPTCIWIITVPDGKVVELSFDSFLRGYTGDDYIEVRDGRYSTSDLKGKRHNIRWRREPKKIRSSDRYLRIEYKSSKREIIRETRFSAHFEAVDPNTGLIVGTVVGGFFLLCCIAITWFIVKRIKSRKRATSNPVPDPSQGNITQSQQPATELTTQLLPTNELPHSQSFGANAEIRSSWPLAESRSSWALAEIHDPKFTVEVPPRYQEQPPPPYSVFRDPPPPYPGAAQDT